MNLRCSVCFGFFNDPRVIPCGHTFCGNCLQSVQSSIICPLCRYVSNINDPSQLPLNFTLRDVVEVFKQNESNKWCECGNPGKKYCPKCEATLCEPCVAIHQNTMFTKRHPLVDSKDAKIVKMCQEHEEPMKMYCEKCKSFVCSSCLIFGHSEHKERVLLISNAIHYQKEKLLLYVKPLEDITLNISNNIVSLDNQLESIIQSILNLQRKKSDLEQRKANFVKEREEIRQQIDVVKRVSHESMDAEILNQGNFDKILKILKLDHFGFKPFSQVGVVKNNPKFKFKFGSKGIGDGQFNGPYSIVIDGTGNIVVADYLNYNIQMFQPDGKFILKFGSGLLFPIGITIDCNGNIFVADSENHQVQQFDSNGKFVQKFGSKGSDDGQFETPVAIAIDSKGNIVVVDRQNNRIQIFGPDGKFIQKFGTKGSDDGQLINPFGVAIDSKGNIIVVENGNHRIQIFGPDGKFIEKFGSYGSSDGQFYHPVGIAIDGKGNIVIADQCNNRIQIFGPDRKFIQKFGGLKSPFALAIDKNGNIFVSEYNSNNDIQVFG